MLLTNKNSAIKKALAACNAVADGDFEARIPDITEAGETGELLHAINALLEQSEAFVRETTASFQYAAENKHFKKLSEGDTPGAYSETIQSINTSIELLERRSESFGEVFSKFEDEMTGVVSEVTDSANNLQSSAKTMGQTTSSASEQSSAVATAAEEASTNVGSVAAATEEMTNSVTEISQQVNHASQITSAAVEEVRQANADVQGLSDSSRKIGEVIALIADIADQTNLLALNTSIEAARAGEAGKGFAVVASEVKSLATQTATATEEIGKQIAEIQTASERAVEAIERIGDTMTKVDEVSTTIAAAVEEQSAATQEIAGNIDQASSGTSKVSTNIQHISKTVSESDAVAAEVMSASAKLSASGENMRGTIQQFLSEARKAI